MPIIDPANNINRKTKVEMLRLILLIALVALIVAAFYWLFFTPNGQENLDREHLKHVGQSFRDWVSRHPIEVTAGFIATYVVLALLALPLWWLQIVGGCGFGLYFGVLWSQCGAVFGAALTVGLSHQLAGDLYKKKIESRQARLKAIDQKLGHNGFLVVMAVRLAHVIPFGLSNYMFGLIHIRPREASLGTLLGNIPVVAFYTSIGAGMQPWKSWRFMTCLATINLLLLIPLALRYFKPEWFEKIGVE